MVGQKQGSNSRPITEQCEKASMSPATACDTVHMMIMMMMCIIYGLYYVTGKPKNDSAYCCAKAPLSHEKVVASGGVPKEEGERLREELITSSNWRFARQCCLAWTCFPVPPTVA